MPRLVVVGPGNSIHTRRWSDFFSHAGLAVGIVSFGEWSDDRPEAELLCELPLTGGSSASRLARVPLALAAAARSVREFGADGVHGHYLTGPAWIATATAGRRPVVLSAWGSDVLIDARRPIVRRADKVSLRRAACVTYDAQVVAEGLLRLGVPSQRLHAAVGGIDTNVFAPGEGDRSAFGLAESDFVVLAPRGVRPLQNPRVILDAFAQFVEREPRGILLLKLGPSEAIALPSDLRRAVADLGDRVRVIGRLQHQELAVLYRSADVCVSVPSSDGTSVALLEAMGCGCPVVASAISANEEWVATNDAGILVPIGDHEALSEALIELAAAPERRAAYSRNAAAGALARADQARELGRLVEVYERLGWAYNRRS
jgi:glycosyltransferase involved in cell wall biosynthesis